MVRTIKICSEYERYLAHYQSEVVVGNGEDECYVCTEWLTDEELDDDENIDPWGNKVCYRCLARYYNFHKDCEVIL